MDRGRQSHDISVVKFLSSYNEDSQCVDITRTPTSFPQLKNSLENSKEREKMFCRENCQLSSKDHLLTLLVLSNLYSLFNVVGRLNFDGFLIP